MTESSPQALLAIRRTCEELKSTVGPIERARLALVTSLLARLIVDARDLPALQSRRQAALQSAASEPDAKPLPLQAYAAVERGHADALEAAINAELRAIAPGEPTGSASGSPERFDHSAFARYLVEQLGESHEVRVASAAVTSRGFSKKTVLVTLEGQRRLPTELALRIDRPFNFLGTTVLDEFEPLRRLYRLGVQLPEPFALEASGRVLDGPFIVFARRPGVLVGNNFQPPPRRPVLAADVARQLAHIHRIDPAGVPALRGVNRCVLDSVRADIATSKAHWQAIGSPEPLMHAAFAWLERHVDRVDGPQAVVHGDFNFNNLLIDGDQVSAIVDWEFLHAGHPAVDLGWFHYGAEGVAGWSEFLDLYQQAGGFAVDPAVLDYFIVLGQTRLAVMTLQTAAGFADGKFDDIKFGLAGALYTPKSLQRIAAALERISSSAEWA